MLRSITRMLAIFLLHNVCLGSPQDRYDIFSHTITQSKSMKVIKIDELPAGSQAEQLNKKNILHMMNLYEGGLIHEANLGDYDGSVGKPVVIRGFVKTFIENASATKQIYNLTYVICRLEVENTRNANVALLKPCLNRVGLAPH